jgi:hypothetical protein
LIALTDEAIARLFIAATRLTEDADRTALLRKFAYVAERRPRADQLRHMEQLPSGGPGETNVSPENRPRAEQVRQMPQLPSGASQLRNYSAVEHRPRSPDAAMRMRQHRARVRNGVAVVGVPVTGAIVGFLVRGGFLRDAEFHERDAIGAAIAAALERAARER